MIKKIFTYFLPHIITNLKLWAEVFKEQFANKGAKYGFTPAQIIENSNDCDWIIYSIKIHSAQKERAAAYKKVRDSVFRGEGTGRVEVPSFVLISAPSSEILPGALNRIRDRAAIIRNAPNYSEADGVELGIIGTFVEVNTDELVSKIVKIVVVDNKINIHWLKTIAEGIVIYGRRGNETEFTPVIRDFKSPSIDARRNLESGPEKREYKVICLVDNMEVGLMSNITEYLSNIH